MSKQKIELKIVGAAHRVKSEDSLLVLISPQYVDYTGGILAQLANLTGHPRHAVIPIPQEDFKLFSVQHPINVEVLAPKPTHIKKEGV